MCTSKTYKNNRKFCVCCNRPLYLGKMQCNAQCHQQSRCWELIFFKKSDLFLCFVYPQSRGLLSEKISSMLIEYIKYNRDLTKKLLARMLWLWELQQTSPVAMKYQSLEYNLQRWDISKVKLETLGEF